MNLKNNRRGITLIALIITIIILFILAGITVTMLTGENGIINRAVEARERTERASLVEQVQIDILIEQSKNTSENLTREQLDSVLGKYFETIPDDYTIDTVLTAKEEYGKYEVAISEFYTGKVEEKIEYAEETQNYTGYYADINADGVVDGIIFADMATGAKGNGQWPDDNSWGNYEIPIKTGLKQYYIKEEEYTDDFGTLPVIAEVENTSGEDRFYVMALDDLDEDRHYWYYNAYGNLDSENNVSNSANDFGTGKEKTQYMITQYENGEYGEPYTSGSYTDMWGLETLKQKVAEGWFVPSKSEWAAFGGELEINTENYVNLGLSDWYWSSSQYDTSSAYIATFRNGYMDFNSVDIDGCVRLCATF